MNQQILQKLAKQKEKHQEKEAILKDWVSNVEKFREWIRNEIKPYKEYLSMTDDRFCANGVFSIRNNYNEKVSCTYQDTSLIFDGYILALKSHGWIFKKTDTNLKEEIEIVFNTHELEEIIERKLCKEPK
jgi:hypothetical protein